VLPEGPDSHAQRMLGLVASSATSSIWRTRPDPGPRAREQPAARVKLAQAWTRWRPAFAFGMAGAERGDEGSFWQGSGRREQVDAAETSWTLDVVTR